MTLRPFIFWPHLAVGVVASLVVLVMSVTGVLLTYERQLIAWSDGHYRSELPSDGARRAAIETGINAVHRTAPGETVTAVTIGAAPDAPLTVTAGGRTFFVNAYTGAVLGEGSSRIRQVMSRLRAWHRWFGVEGEGRAAARAITGWANFLFVFLILTGMYLWLPRVWKWSTVKAVLLFKRGASSKARDFNWHHVIGIWSAVPLLIVVVSALPISFPWANAAVYRAVGETPPAGRGGAGANARNAGGQRAERNQPRGERREPAAERQPRSNPQDFTGFDRLFDRAAQQVAGWRTISLRVPDSAAAPLVFTVDQGDGGQPQLRSTLTLARATGDVVSVEPFSSQTPGRRIRSLMRFAHTGEVLGLAGQTVAGIVSAGSVVLVWTGLALASRRMAAWLMRRFARPARARTSDRTSAVA